MRARTLICSLLCTFAAASLGAAPEEGSAPPVLVAAPGSALRLEPAAPGDRTEAALNGGVFVAASELEVPQAGDHWLALVSRDAVGNVSPVRWIRLRVDDEAPELGLEVRPSPVPDERGRLWVPGGTEVEARAHDAVAGVGRVWLRTGGRERESEGKEPLAAALGSDGSCAAWARDRVGNESRPREMRLHVDSTPPTAQIHVEGAQVRAGDRLVLGPRARLRLETDDEGSGVGGVTRSIDDREVESESWAGPWPAGRHEAGASVSDRVGNRTAVPPLVFEVDVEAPRITWAVESEGVADEQGRLVFRPPVSVRVLAEDDAAGVDGLDWFEEGSGWRDVADRFDTSAGAVRLRARDRVGNTVETPASWSLDGDPPRVFVDEQELDPTAPPVVLEREAGDGLRIGARDGGVGVGSLTLSVDGDPERPAPDVIRFLDPGRHRLAVRATDRLGNHREVEWDLRVVRGP